MTGGPLVVVGDTILDRDLTGRVERLCPDAPAPVLDVYDSLDRPGGAGLAAALGAAAGAEVVLVTAVADDAAGARLLVLLAEAGVAVIALPYSGRTVEKVRLRADGQVIARVDQGVEIGDLGEPAPAALAALRDAAAVVVSDYGRGVAGLGPLRKALMRCAARRPLVWDPHPRGAEPVRGARLVTPNESELAHHVADTGGVRLRSIAQRAAKLREQWQAAAIAVTLGADGALVCHGGATPLVAPPPYRADGDSCGAGDQFAATAAAALADGALVSEAVQDAVSAAAAYVAGGGAAAWRARRGATSSAPRAAVRAATSASGRYAVSDAEPESSRTGGDRPAPPSIDDGLLGLAMASAVAEGTRLRGGTVVATGGCFDLLHTGHVATLQAARGLGDCLIVCLNSDASVHALKGPDRPVVVAADRARLLAALSCVDAVVTFDEATPRRLLAQLRPDVWVKGGDYDLDAPDGRPVLPEAELVRAWGGQTVIVPYLAGHSTTQLIAAARASGLDLGESKSVGDGGAAQPSRGPHGGVGSGTGKE